MVLGSRPTKVYGGRSKKQLTFQGTGLSSTNNTQLSKVMHIFHFYISWAVSVKEHLVQNCSNSILLLLSYAVGAEALQQFLELQP